MVKAQVRLEHGTSARSFAGQRWRSCPSHPSENPVTLYDFHATIPHLLGLDHEHLTHYHNGLHRRLTDVHGRVIQEILA
jgi:Protein of unknown function (DUF1501)